MSAYCDNEVSQNTKDNIEASLALSCDLVHRVLKINTLKKILNDTFEKKFENIELNLEKKVIERLKSQSIASRIKKFFLKN